MQSLELHRLSNIYKVQSGTAEYNDSWYEFTGFTSESYKPGVTLLEKFSTPKFYRNYENALIAIGEAVVEEYLKSPTDPKDEDRKFTEIILEDWIYGNKNAETNLKNLHEYIKLIQSYNEDLDNLDSDDKLALLIIIRALAKTAMALNLVKIETLSHNIKFEDE